MIASSVHCAPLDLTCPSCGAVLSPASDDALECTVDGASYRIKNGIWDLISPDRSVHFRPFVCEYDRIRASEGRGGAGPAYYRRLPFRDATGRFRRDWRIRARSFECFVRNVLEPLEAVGPETEAGARASRPETEAGVEAPRPETEPRGDTAVLPSTRRRLRILDLGAGNGWFSYRMALRGHTVYAVDLRTDDIDGLGACVHYDRAFPRIRAEFDRLPFPPGSADLVVFNASFHYSECYEETLREAQRVLVPTGRAAIIDSPIYEESESGRAMVAERSARFLRTYGFASDSLGSEHFLTPSRLRRLSVRTGITWTKHTPRYGPRWAMRRAVSRMVNGREAAQFRVLVGCSSLDVPAEIFRVKPPSIRQALGRIGLRARYLAGQRSRLRREVEETVAGLRLRIVPGVFHPVVFRSGAFMAELIGEGVLPAGARVLDLGCGAGAAALAATRRGAAVTAVDINPKAVACTRLNANLNGLEVRTVEGDLFEGLGRFDAVLFNPPYYAGRASSDFEWAWQSDEVVDRFTGELRSHLTAGGFALVALSSDGWCPEYLRRFHLAGYALARVAERRFTNETLSIFRLA